MGSRCQTHSHKHGACPSPYRRGPRAPRTCLVPTAAVLGHRHRVLGYERPQTPRAATPPTPRPSSVLPGRGHATRLCANRGHVANAAPSRFRPRRGHVASRAGRRAWRRCQAAVAKRALRAQRGARGGRGGKCERLSHGERYPRAVGRGRGAGDRVSVRKGAGKGPGGARAGVGAAARRRPGVRVGRTGLGAGGSPRCGGRGRWEDAGWRAVSL